MRYLGSSTIGELVADSSIFPCSEKGWAGILLHHGWPEDSYTDSIGGAQGFMALATVDVYITIPPTCIYRWCAHFAEVIVKAHLHEIQGTEPVVHPPDFRHARANIIEIYGASSPSIA